MKKFIIWLLVLSVGGYALVWQYPTILSNPRSLLYYSPCDTPLAYKIGFIDSRFGISQAQLVTDLHEAESVWESDSEKDLFVNNPQALLTVQMKYDTRQALTQKLDTLENTLSQDKVSVQSQIADFEAKSAQFKKDVDEFNKQVAYWNSKGGAPKDEYNKLQSTQAGLQSRSQELSTLATSLNRSTAEFNNQIGTFNSTVNSLNQELQVRPEEGLYDPNTNTITIFITSSHYELVHTLAHELGHALGMNHVEGLKSIMYTSTSTSLIPSEEDTAEFTYVCRERTTLEWLQNKVIEFVRKYQTTGKLN